jgi:competence protein ComEC
VRRQDSRRPAGANDAEADGLACGWHVPCAAPKARPALLAAGTVWLRAACIYIAALCMPLWTAMALGVALAVRGRRLDRGAGLLHMLAAFAGGIDAVPATPHLDAPATARVCGWIASAPERDARGTSAWLVVDTIDSTAAVRAWRGARVRLRARSTLPAYGTRVAVDGRLQPAAAPRNFGAADARAVLRAAGGAAELDAVRVRAVPGRAGPAWRREILEPLRTRLHAILMSTLGPAEAGLLAALVLGRRDGVDPALAAAWSALGLTHVLSISGMHVALVAAALVALCGAPTRGRGLAALIGGVWAYAALGGLGPTVLRAALMATWAAVALYLGRGRRPLAALGLAAIALVLHAPARRHDLGLQLSVLSTAGLLCWAPVLARGVLRATARGGVARLVAAAGAAAGIGLAAQAATLPLVVWRFGVVSWAAPVANLVAVPCTDLALVLALFGTPLALVADVLGRPLLLAAGALVAGLAHVSALAVAAGETRLFVPADLGTVVTAAAVAAAVCACGLCASAARRRATRATGGIALAALVAFVVACAWPRAPAWQMETLDVGQGDALVLRVGQAAWLVDAGDARPVDRGARVVVPHLRRSGVRRLRGLVLSHPHRDHCGGAASVLAAVAVDTVYVAGASWDDSSYVRLRDAHRHVPWRALSRGDTLHLSPGYRARVLWPGAHDEIGGGPNECSLVLWAHGSGHPDVWFMGDLETAGEAALVGRDSSFERARAAFTLLKAGHHGSDTSSTAALVDALLPEVAIVSVGAGNRYRHPGRRALATLAARGCRVLRTDEGGAVRIVQRGATLWLERPAARRAALASPG